MPKKRLFKALFLEKSLKKQLFLKLFSCYEKRLHSPFLPLHRQNKEVWVSGLNQHTANVPNRKVPKVRILLLPHFGSLAQLDQSTTLRTSVSGVRVSHESHNIGGLAELVYCTGLENRQAATSQRFEIALSECRSQACLDYAECLAILIEIL